MLTGGVVEQPHPQAGKAEIMRVEELSCRLPHGRQIVSHLNLIINKGVNVVIQVWTYPSTLSCFTCGLLMCVGGCDACAPSPDVPCHIWPHQNLSSRSLQCPAVCTLRRRLSLTCRVLWFVEQGPSGCGKTSLLRYIRCPPRSPSAVPLLTCALARAHSRHASPKAADLARGSGGCGT